MTGLTFVFYGINLYIFNMKLEGFSNYEIYPEEGKIWSYKSNRFIGSIRPSGYYSVSLSDDNGNLKVCMLHRIIWKAVNGEIPYGMQINHIDLDRTNNSISNLNLMTPTENNHWGDGYIKRSKTNKKNQKVPRHSVLAFKNKQIKLFFPSLMEAKRKGFHPYHIIETIKGEKTHHKGYQWQYVDDYLADWWEQEMERIEF